MHALGGRGMSNAATIKDVALKAGCGVATVSRVLNNTGSASPKMRERVSRAVKELDFQFSEVGRSLQSSKSNTCLLYTSPSPRDGLLSRMPSSA